MTKSLSPELNTDLMPPRYQAFANAEAKYVREFAKDTRALLDVGCGEGRSISFTAPFVKQWVGIDINATRLAKASEIANAYDHVQLKYMDARDLTKYFSLNYFSRSIMLFSTFGCVPEPAHVLKEVASVTSDAVYFSIMAKGNLEHRISYYTSLEIPHTIDFGTETIYSSVWGESRAYSPDEIEVFCRAVGLRVQDLKLHNELAFFVVGEK